MEHKTWKFQLKGEDHIVRLDWTYWGGRREVFVDGQQRHESIIPMRWRSSQVFELEGSHCVVTTEPTGLMSPKFRISLEIDGEGIKPQPGSSFWEG
ncbi:MAG: hypothetical protein WAX12_15080 [Candidatus Microthrix subdominans]|uniref:hypothetical protein n=1 Tax=Candidatus Neomicrothrix sp. TaxID=2719034 RepID=UPI001E14D1C4|nr:hypothetical protein [Candidatus Microthrix sp.]MBK6437824.1 hypothetical protein [Candidatus Microthrix sp.]MBK9561187.1 hypothetical protein [Candidatus Microthrix sp.]HMS46422.1 hypothetical protein [Candidatus Microthrix sp.]